MPEDSRDMADVESVIVIPSLTRFIDSVQGTNTLNSRQIATLDGR
jgi:hypothetical protein